MCEAKEEEEGKEKKTLVCWKWRREFISPCTKNRYRKKEKNRPSVTSVVLHYFFLSLFSSFLQKTVYNTRIMPFF